MSEYSEKNLYERIVDRQGRLEQVRLPFEPARKTIVELFRTDLTLEIDNKGKFVGNKIIEGSGPWALNVMAKGFQGSLVGRSIEWLRYQMREQIFKGVDEVNHWLQQLEEQMYWAYRNSNYYEMLPGFIMDGLSVGSPVTIADEDVVGKTHFTVPHFTENFLSQNWFGEDDVYHRAGGWKMTAMQAIKKFDKKDLSNTLNRALESGHHFKEFEFIMAIYSEEDEIFDDLKDSDKEDAPNRPWMQYYIEKDADEDKKKILLAKGYFSKPFSAWHYYRNPHETYARTPAWAAIQDVQGNNAMWTTLYEAAEYTVRPAMWAMGNQKNRLRLNPGASNWVDGRDDYDRPPVPIKRDINYPFGMDFADRVASKVERHFHVKLFQMIEQYNREHKQPPTAYQIFQMLGENAGQLGPAVQSFEGGLLKSNDDRMMDIEGRAGRLPPLPDIVLEYAAAEGLENIDVDPQFTGPLAMAQQVFLGVNRIHIGLTGADPIFERWPETKYKVRASLLVEDVLEKANFPQDKIVPEDEYQETIAEMARLEQEDRQLEQAEKVAKMIPSVSKDVEPNSPIAALTGATA